MPRHTSASLLFLLSTQLLLAWASVMKPGRRMVDTTGDTFSATMSTLPGMTPSSSTEIAPMPSATLSRQAGEDVNVAAIVGGAVAGYVILVVVAAFIIYLARHPRLFTDADRLETPRKLNDPAIMLATRPSTPGDDLFISSRHVSIAQSKPYIFDRSHIPIDLPPRSQQSVNLKHTYDVEEYFHSLESYPKHFQQI